MRIERITGSLCFSAMSYESCSCECRRFQARQFRSSVQGADLRRLIMGQHHVTDSCFLLGSSTRYLRGMSPNSRGTSSCSQPAQAFTIYTFFQLLINFLGGERSLIIMMHGRPPKNHAWPLNYVLNKVDISDPHTFLAIKRGILQYAWLKPVLSIMTIVLKLLGIYQEGQLSVYSGYLWIGILYNVSVTVSLYSLAMFWVCMSQDLKPFRPVPKFLCIKLIIFASYWQGFFLSILQVLGAIPSGVEGYGSADNLAAAIQDALICLEMPIFAVAHWYAFSWHDYADITISAARMPVKYALRDAFGIRDLIEDTKETFGGKKYEYRAFDSGDSVLAHEESDSHRARLHEGMRYSKDKGKYWIPKPGESTARTPLLGGSGSSGSDPAQSHGTMGGDELDGGGMDEDLERVYTKARALEYGDWNYPVVTAHVPARDVWNRANPNLLTTSTNRNLLQPTKANRNRREGHLEESLAKGKGRSSSSSADENARPGKDPKKSHHKVRAPVVENLIRGDSSTSSRSVKSGRSQLVDVIVHDEDADETERVRARKEGGAEWNKDEPEHFVYEIILFMSDERSLITIVAPTTMQTKAQTYVTGLSPGTLRRTFRRAARMSAARAHRTIRGTWRTMTLIGHATSGAATRRSDRYP